MKKHAYLITAYQNRDQVEQLLNLLDDERNDVYLQVDAKSSFVVDGLAMQRSGLAVLPPFPIYWGGFSFTQAILNLLRAASINHYHYYHLLTDADLPLVNQDRVHEFLADSTLEYVSFSEISPSFPHWKAAYYHVLVETKWYRNCWPFRMLGHLLVKLQSLIGIDRSRKTGVRYYHGSTYFSITHVLVEHILAHGALIREMYRHTLACDEVFLQTLLMNSPLCSRIASTDAFTVGNLRYIIWGRGSGNSPYTFKMSDYGELKKASEHCFFARKFNRAVDPILVDTIVRNIKERGTL